MNRSRRPDPETGYLAGFYRELRSSRLNLQAEQDSERLIATMPLPDPFDFDQLVGNIAEASGRRIVMKPIPDHLTGLDGTCGLFIPHDTHPVDLILHPKGRSPSDELNLKVHQLVHLWAGDHTGIVRSPGILRAHAGGPDKGLPTAGPSAHDALIELRADTAARLIAQRRRPPDRPAGSRRGAPRRRQPRHREPHPAVR